MEIQLFVTQRRKGNVFKLYVTRFTTPLLKPISRSILLNT
jgi:hypothetical protein